MTTNRFSIPTFPYISCHILMGFWFVVIWYGLSCPVHDLSACFVVVRLGFPEMNVSIKRKREKLPCITKVESLFSRFTGHFKSRRKRTPVFGSSANTRLSCGLAGIERRRFFLFSAKIKLWCLSNYGMFLFDFVFIFHYLFDLFRYFMICLILKNFIYPHIFILLHFHVFRYD